MCALCLPISGAHVSSHTLTVLHADLPKLSHLTLVTGLSRASRSWAVRGVNATSHPYPQDESSSSGCPIPTWGPCVYSPRPVLPPRERMCPLLSLGPSLGKGCCKAMRSWSLASSQALLQLRGPGDGQPCSLTSEPREELGGRWAFCRPPAWSGQRRGRPTDRERASRRAVGASGKPFPSLEAESL